MNANNKNYDIKVTVPATMQCKVDIIKVTDKRTGNVVFHGLRNGWNSHRKTLKWA